MRLISTFNTEKEAYNFYSFLLKEGIQNIYEPFVDSQSQEKQYTLWVYDEEDFETALTWLDRYREHPEDPQFQGVQTPLIVTPVRSDSDAPSGDRETSPPGKKQGLSLGLTHLILVTCVFLFLWNEFEEEEIVKSKGPLAALISFTPIQEALLFDFPSAFQYIDKILSNYDLKPYKELKDLPPEVQALRQKAEESPTWKGVYDFLQTARKKGWSTAKQIPLFEKIRQGELWRLFTPCLLHRDFLHILFNMAWAWILGRQIEDRVRKWKVVLLILTLGIVSNIAQYLMSGAYFLGFSGVAVGMAGFIWMRQKKAPWEGYPLHKGTILFLLLFVLSMCALEVVTFFLELFSVIDIAPTIANTAHIVGGLCGMWLGRSNFFARSLP